MLLEAILTLTTLKPASPSLFIRVTAACKVRQQTLLPEPVWPTNIVECLYKKRHGVMIFCQPGRGWWRLGYIWKIQQVILRFLIYESPLKIKSVALLLFVLMFGIRCLTTDCTNYKRMYHMLSRLTLSFWFRKVGWHLVQLLEWPVDLLPSIRFLLLYEARRIKDSKTWKNRQTGIPFSQY